MASDRHASNQDSSYLVAGDGGEGSPTGSHPSTTIYGSHAAPVSHRLGAYPIDSTGFEESGKLQQLLQEIEYKQAEANTFREMYEEQRARAESALEQLRQVKMRWVSGGDFTGAGRTSMGVSSNIQGRDTSACASGNRKLTVRGVHVEPAVNDARGWLKIAAVGPTREGQLTQSTHTP